MKILSIGDRIRHGTYRLHSRFRRVVNLLDGRSLVSVVEADVGAGPINIVVSGIDIGGIRRLSVDGQTLSLNALSCRIDPDRSYDSALEIEADQPPAFDANLALLGELLVEKSPPRSLAFLLDGGCAPPCRGRFDIAVLERLSEGVAMIFRGELLGGVRILRGCGFGLTPSGDDFVAGLLIAMRLVSRMYGTDLGETVESVRRVSRSRNVLSESLLAFAGEGRLNERMKNLVQAVLYGTGDRVRHHAERLLLVGDTSGADLGTGFCMTMQRRKMFVQGARPPGSRDALLLREGGSG